VVVSTEKVKELGLKPQAKILGYATFSREPEWFTLAPISAIQRLLKLLSLGRGPVRDQRSLRGGANGGDERVGHSA
jgi:acetyl-CoA C-acetyltransferase